MKAKGSGKLQAIAAEHGESVEELVLRLMGENRTVLRAAQAVNVAPNTIRYHLQRMGFKPAATNQPSIEWVKAE